MRNIYYCRVTHEYSRNVKMCSHVVLRQYCGCDTGIPKNNAITRLTYGYKSHVGTDPYELIRKPFDCNLKAMSRIIMSNLRSFFGGYLSKEMNLTQDF